MPDKLFYTRTMAQVYERQGDLLHAARIYRYLLARAPGCKDLVQVLERIDRRLGGCDVRVQNLKELFGRWITLMLHANDLQKLNRIVTQKEVDTCR